MNPQTRELRERLIYVIGAITAVLLFGTTGYHFVHPDHPGFLDCLYQTVVIITTLGMDPLSVSLKSAVPGLKVFTIILILAGASVVAYAFTSLTAFVVEGELTNLLGRRRMDREIAKLHDHYVVCGAGRTGTYVIEELQRTKRPFVVIDTEETLLRELASKGPILYLLGDATEDSILHKARLEQAAGLLACLPSDRDNLFLVITARQLNSKLTIIARGYELTAHEKIKRAGADALIYPNFIGGMRMVSTMVRPHVVNFLDVMLREGLHQYRFEEAVIHESSILVGKSLAASQIREKTGLVIVAIRRPDGEFVYNLPPETVLETGMALVVVGEPEQLARLRELSEHLHHLHLPHLIGHHEPHHRPGSQAAIGNREASPKQASAGEGKIGRR